MNKTEKLKSMLLDLDLVLKTLLSNENKHFKFEHVKAIIDLIIKEYNSVIINDPNLKINVLSAEYYAKYIVNNLDEPKLLHQDITKLTTTIFLIREIVIKSLKRNISLISVEADINIEPNDEQVICRNIKSQFGKLAMFKKNYTIPEDISFRLFKQNSKYYLTVTNNSDERLVLNENEEIGFVEYFRSHNA